MFRNGFVLGDVSFRERELAATVMAEVSSPAQSVNVIATDSEIKRAAENKLSSLEF